MRLPVFLLTLLASGAAGTMLAQSATAAFDIVSIKRYQPAATRRPSDAISVLPGGRFSAPSATLRGLIAAAYGLLDIQIVDSGRLLGTDRFEIEARTKPDVSIDNARTMLRSLLAGRFGLATHRETRELPVYFITRAREDEKPGPEVRPSGPECAPVKGPAGIPPPPPPPGPPPGQAVGQVLALHTTPSRCPSVFFNSTVGSHWSFREITIARVAERLIAALGRPVFDRTGLDGAFDIDLTYSSDSPAADASGAPDAPSLLTALREHPSLLTALREQLGLHLESTKATVDVLVIDRVRPPTEN